MPWTNLAFYKDIYLMGDTTAQIVADVPFPRMVARAEEEINWRNTVLPDDFIAPVYLQKAVCAVAELLYMRQQALSGVDSNGEQIMKSFSNKGYSESFFIPQEELTRMTQTEFDRQIRGVVLKYLNGTEMHQHFVYAGV